MRLTDGVEWALHAVVILAFTPPGVSLPTRRLAEYHELPEAYLNKHLQALARAGVLESVPGPKGGFRLARPAAETTVLDVVEALDGSQPAFRCNEIRRCGPAAAADPGAYRLPCRINAVMRAADAAWRASLQGVTIADLAQDVMEGVAPESLAKGAAWLAEAVQSRMGVQGGSSSGRAKPAREGARAADPLAIEETRCMYSSRAGRAFSAAGLFRNW